MEFKPNTSKYQLSSNFDYTKGQITAANKILDWFYNPSDNTPFTLSGFAGTGKTTIAKDIIRNIKGKIACTAPTHKAVRVASNTIGIEGSTIQKLLGLRPNTDLDNFDINKPQFDPLGNIYIKNYKFILVDECSMINRSLFKLLVTSAKKYEVKLLFMGDPYQLPPVGEHYSLTFDTKTIKNLYNLTEIVRQEDGNPLIKILEMIRKDVRYKSNNFVSFLSKRNSNYNDNTEEGFIITNPVHFSELLDDRFTSHEFERNIDYCRYTAFTNRSVSNVNHHIRKVLFGEQSDVVIMDDLFTSYSTIMNEFNSPLIVNSEDYIINKLLNYNNKYLVKGYLANLRKINGGTVTDDLFILDHTDKENLERYITIFSSLLSATKTSNLAKRRTAWEKFFEFKNYNLLLNDVYTQSGKLIASKDLDYGFGLTVHKTQGSTFHSIFVNARDIIYKQSGMPYANIGLRNRLLYVALSRASKNAMVVI